MIRHFLRFALVGLIATITTYAVLVLLVERLSVDTVLASALGYFCGAVVNYLLNYFYTFSSTRRHLLALPRFTLIVFVGFLLNTAIMYGSVTVLPAHYLLAQLIAVAIVLVWSFMANRYWAFA